MKFSTLIQKKILRLFILLSIWCFVTTKVFSQSKEPLWTTVFDSPQASFEEIQKDFENYWRDKDIEKGKGYKPFKRWEAFMKPRIYPSGDMTLPSTTYNNYMEWLRTQPDGASQRSMVANWTNVGPIGVPAGADTGIGRLNMLRFDPDYDGTTNQTMYVGAPDGGLWKSTNNGGTWATIGDALAMTGVSDLVFNPSNTNIMYLATGDIEGTRRSSGVIKSTNGGTNWSTTALIWTPEDNYRISKLLMDPAAPDKMLISTDGGIFRTTDGWVSWINYMGSENLKDMEFKPGDVNTVYAAGTKFWRSADNGITWTQITSGLPTSNISRIAIGVSANNPNVVYALIGRLDNQGFLGLYRSDDSGLNFSLKSSSPNILGYVTDGSDTGGQAFFDLAIAVSPANVDIVTTGGVNHWQSTDAGVTWTIKSHWDPGVPGFQFVHADIHEVVYAPGVAGTTLYSCHDGGIAKSPDNGTTWTDLSNNLSVAQQNRIGVSATSASLMIAGLQDIGSIKKSGTWSIIGGGDGGHCFIDFSNDMNMVITGTNGTHYLSTNGGTSFNPISGGGTGLPDGSGNAEFYSSIGQDPVSATRFYAGGRPLLYVTNNSGTSWTALPTLPAGTGNVVEFAVAPSNNAILYVIKNDAIVKSVNSGAAWTDITGTLPVGSAALTNLAVSNTDPLKVWVTFSGYSAANKVFKTTDGGSTWTNISTGLPNLPINTIAYQKNSANEIVYVGADVGVYYIDNTQTSFQSYSTALATASVRDLKIVYEGSGFVAAGKIRAATYGRGAWESDLVVPLPVELISFTGKNKGSENILLWTTATESEFSHYAVERSNDGRTFETLGKVLPEFANSETEQNYSYTDEYPFKGINYYRLKMVDLDGSSEYSRTIAVFMEDADSGISLFPNPATNFIEVKGVIAENTIVRFMNSSGTVVNVQSLSENNQVNVSRFPSGIYYAEILSEGRRIAVKRFVRN
jgi:Secretion system C-terminal sorting domain